MLRKLRILFTFTGIMLLLGTIFSDEWASAGDRFSYAILAICMLIVCQPAHFIRFSHWVWASIKSLLSSPRNSIRSTNHDSTEDDSSAAVDCKETFHKDARMNETSYSREDSYEYSPPTKISRGNIATISDEEMNVLLRHYYKADEIKTKVKGVSFRNDDGTDRQSILAHCHAGDQLRFKPFEYKGDPAYAVYCDWGQIGNLSADIAKEIAARGKPCIILGEILNVSGGYHGEYFGCNICISIYEKY